MSKYLISSCDETYFNKNKNYLYSVNKNSKIQNILLCIGFLPPENFLQYTPNIKYIHIPLNELNHDLGKHVTSRKNFLCIQNGEFTKFLPDVKNDDVIIFLDYDFIQQRPFESEELAILDDVKDGDIYMNTDGYVYNYVFSETYIMQDIPVLKEKLKNSDQSNGIIYNSGLMIATKSTFAKVFEKYVEFYPITSVHVNPTGKNHAFSQWLINYVAHSDFSIKKLADTFVNAFWFKGNPCTFQNEQMYCGNKVVLFNHTKFNWETRF